MIIGRPARELAPLERLELAAREFQRVLFRSLLILTALVLAAHASAPLVCASACTLVSATLASATRVSLPPASGIRVSRMPVSGACFRLVSRGFDSWTLVSVTLVSGRFGPARRRRETQDHARHDGTGNAGGRATPGTLCKPPTSPHADQSHRGRMVPLHRAPAPARKRPSGLAAVPRGIADPPVSTAR